VFNDKDRSRDVADFEVAIDEEKGQLTVLFAPIIKHILSSQVAAEAKTTWFILIGQYVRNVLRRIAARQKSAFV